MGVQDALRDLSGSISLVSRTKGPLKVGGPIPLDYELLYDR